MCLVNNSEVLEKLEELLATWQKQIEQVLTEAEQIRREADNIGPTAELSYWKGRMAKFNTSVDYSLLSVWFYVLCMAKFNTSVIYLFFSVWFYVLRMAKFNTSVIYLFFSVWFYVLCMA